MTTKDTATEKPADEPVPFDVAALDIATRDPEKVALDLFRRVLEAPNLDAAFNVLEGKTSRDYIGQWITFHSVDLEWYTPADRDDAIPSVKSNATYDDGESFNFWTSSGMLVALLAKAKMAGALPVRWKIVEKRTNAGQQALNFERSELVESADLLAWASGGKSSPAPAESRSTNRAGRPWVRRLERCERCREPVWMTFPHRTRRASKPVVEELCAFCWTEQNDIDEATNGTTTNRPDGGDPQTLFVVPL